MYFILMIHYWPLPYQHSKISRVFKRWCTWFRSCRKKGFLGIKFNDAIGFGIFFVFTQNAFYLQKKSVRSREWCCTFPKIMPDNPKNDAGPSQKLCPTTVRHNFLNLFRDPESGTWQFDCNSCTEEYKSAGGHLGIGSDQLSIVSTCS